MTEVGGGVVEQGPCNKCDCFCIGLKRENGLQASLGYIERPYPQNKRASKRTLHKLEKTLWRFIHEGLELGKTSWMWSSCFLLAAVNLLVR